MGVVWALKRVHWRRSRSYKDLRRNGQNRAITPMATYTPTSKRASSRSLGTRLDHSVYVR
ncbi:hypothetical protein FEI15_02300 [Lacticaseibacillus zeae]|uniref:Uncharacterized protein n=1 Tax=Lacticaseibacillus zeae TaxID=57037 RepID=A0A5R8LVI6_LACZE|nr:hypothetical protein FEI15_02300 [Lacticaseibacillus zeae]TLF43013.1 hypothetical protein FEI14_04710 [Lacticaseibacillus zeae]